MQSSITCTQCWMTSYHPDDVKHGYCGNCHSFIPDGVVCRDADNALDTRYVHNFSDDNIAAIVRTDDGSIGMLTRSRIAVGMIEYYRDMLKVARDESTRIIACKDAERRAEEWIG